MLVLSGCASGNGGEPTQTSETTTSSTSTKATTSKETPTTTESSTETVTPTEEPQAVPEVSGPAAVPEAVATTTRFNPGEEYGEVCYSGTPDQWPRYVNPVTGCGATLNPDYREPVPEPVFVECIYGGGAWTENARFSDGSYGPHPECQALRDQQLAENPYVCQGTDWHVPDPSYCNPALEDGSYLDDGASELESELPY